MGKEYPGSARDEIDADPGVYRDDIQSHIMITQNNRFSGGKNSLLDGTINITDEEEQVLG